MEDENYRNFVVSRLNTSLDKKLAEEDLHCEDVVCVVWHVTFANYSLGKLCVAASDFAVCIFSTVC